MRINEIVNFCDNEFQKRRCEGCDKSCNHDCNKCLYDLHYHKKEIRDNYECEHLLDYYVCKYSYKYCSEIIYALRSIDLSRYNKFNIVSFGCGAAPDLMAFDCLNSDLLVRKEIIYQGIDNNTYLEKIHNKMINVFSNYDISFIRDCDAITFLDNHEINDCNVIIIEYLISFIYDGDRKFVVYNWFKEIVEKIVSNKMPDTPMLIIINDADSCYTGRDTFDMLIQYIEDAGFTISTNIKKAFKKDHHYDGAEVYERQRNIFSVPENIKNNYKAALNCSSVQLIIEVE
ncbi:MAG: hypothetical protein ACLUFN_03540 [Eubacterium sp.]